MSDFTPDPRIAAMVKASTAVVEDGWKALTRARRDTGVYLAEKEVFFAGASFLYDALMNGIDRDAEPTEIDVAVVNKLHRELQQFNQGFNSKLLRGRAR